MPLIQTVDLCQRFGERDVLKNINLEVERGEVFALIGPTGSGKTTLLRLIDLLDEPTSGKIYFDGTDVTTLRRRRLETRRRMAFVLQKPTVFNTSIYHNVACGLKWRGIPRRELDRRVNRVLEMVGLAQHRDRNARTLSGGEVQRVAIARAIAIEPEVLLLDEPTANLDPVSTSRIEDLIRGIIGHYHTTIIMATHDLAQGQRLAERAAVLLDGQIQQSGGWGEIFRSPPNRAVADFIGVENQIDGVIVSSQEQVVAIDVGGNTIEAISHYPVGEEVSACIRAEDITLALSPTSTSARNSFAGEVTRVVPTGPLARVEIDCGFPLVALVTRRSAGELGLARGKRVYASFKASAIHIIRKENT